METIWVLRHFAFLSADEQWESISKGTSPSPTCIPLLVKSRWFGSNHPGKCLRWGSERRVWALWRLMFSRRIVAEKGDPALLFFYNGSTEKGWRGWTLNGGATKQHLLNHRWLSFTLKQKHWSQALWSHSHMRLHVYQILAHMCHKEFH